MTSYFWSGFPSLSGRSDVMYGRRHIGGATHPLRHPYRLGLLRYRSTYHRCPTLPRFTRPLSLFLSLLASLLSIPFSPINIVKVNIPSKLTSRLLINRSCINRYCVNVRASRRSEVSTDAARSTVIPGCVVLSRARARDTGRNRN